MTYEEALPSPVGDYVSSHRQQNTRWEQSTMLPSPVGDYVSSHGVVTMTFRERRGFRPLSGIMFLHPLFMT